MKFPDFAFELPLWKKGFSVIGIDEVGRGAFAGPVGIGGVVFDPNLSSQKRAHLLSLGIHDSKKLTAKKRDELSLKIKELALEFGTSFIDVKTINEIGIGKATFLGMATIAKQLFKKVKNPHLLIDAFEIPAFPYPQRGIVYGDTLSLSIAAASIIAKVERDRLMKELGLKFPNYAWESNKGYGTLNHRRAIAQFGKTQYHREDFCRNIGAHLLF